MPWSKENNPHTNPKFARKGDAKTKSKKKESVLYVHKGVPQVGDAALYGDNPEAYYTQHYVPVNAVGPGDIVDDADPTKRYTFYLFEPTGNKADEARELDRLRRSKWFKCEAPRFISPTGKFETRDGVLVLGLGTWYALPIAVQRANRKAVRDEYGPLTVAEHHAGLAAQAKVDGMTGEASTRADSRGERT